MNKTAAHPEPSESLAQWLQAVKEAGLKRTPTREAILRCLIGHHELLRIEEVVAEIQSRKMLQSADCDYSTVYRCLLKFEEAGLAVSTDLGDGVKRFELKGPHHHHHVVCRVCKKVEPIDDCALTRTETQVQKMGYKQVDHRLEFFGICSRCSKAV